MRVQGEELIEFKRAFKGRLNESKLIIKIYLEIFKVIFEMWSMKSQME